jgi:DNA (cytosine-5)-methyltransferase 1
MRSVELFAGCGGLALGIARAGFAHDIVIERDSDSVLTLTGNKDRKIKHVRDWNIEQGDTRELDFRCLEGADFLSGGPPCQPFSIGGKHLGPKDSRNMWPEAIRAIREIRPKAFVLENVRGLLRPDFEHYLDYITLQLTYPGTRKKNGENWRMHLARLRMHAKGRGRKNTAYKVVAQGINAADYGAPQKRYRAVIMGISSKLGEDWEFPPPTHSQEALVWSKHIDRDYWERHGMRRIATPSSDLEARISSRLKRLDTKPKGRPWVTVRDAIGDLPLPNKRETISGHWQHPGARAYPHHTGSSLDEPAKALKAGDHGVPGGENMLAFKNGEVRYFTVREMARLQGLPDDFWISGSWKAATRQLGNAVPTTVGEIMGKAVLKIMNRKERAQVSEAHA